MQDILSFSFVIDPYLLVSRNEYLNPLMSPEAKL